MGVADYRIGCRVESYGFIQLPKCANADHLFRLERMFDALWPSGSWS